jgi:hypothetical protein
MMRLPCLVLTTALAAGILSATTCHADAEIRSWIDANGTPVFSNLASGPATTARTHPAAPGDQPANIPPQVANSASETEPSGSDKDQRPVEHDALQDH